MPLGLVEIDDEMFDGHTRFITLLNTSVVDAEQLRPFVELVYRVEVALLIVSWFELTFVCYLLIFVRAMHFNLNLLFINYGGQYFFSIAARCVMLYFQLGDDHQGDRGKEILYWANYIRTICLFIAFNILPTFMLERLIATCLVKDYEQKRRLWVPASILAVFYPFCIASGLAYIRYWVPVWLQVTSFLALNVLSYFGLLVIYKYNVKRHRNAMTGMGKAIRKRYLLSERFQLAENIKMCELLKKVQVSIIFFNAGSTSVLLMDELAVPPRLLCHSYLFFNLFCLLYGLVQPVVVYCYLPEWHQAMKRMVTCGMGNRVQPKSTMGEKMIYTSGAETEIYFSQLQLAFDAGPRRASHR